VSAPARESEQERALRAGGEIPVYAALGGFAAAVWLPFALATKVRFEDAYITFRYARNLAEGHGFVYNIGERVLGTTTPLQTLLLAALGLAAGPERIPAISSVVMPLFGVAAVLTAYAALTRLGVSRLGAAAGCLLFAAHPLVIRTTLGGMETPLVVFLMALGLYFLARGQTVAASAAASALVLCRIDGLIWAALVVGAAMLRDRRPWMPAAAFGAVVAPWLVFAALYFGNPIPNTMLAKGVVRPGREHLLTQPVHLARLLRFYASGLGLRVDQRPFPMWVGLLALGGWFATRARRRELVLLAVYPPLYAALMYLGRAPMYQWYLAPMLFASTLLAGVAIGGAVGWVARRSPTRPVKAAAVACAAALLIPPAVEGLGDLPAQVRHLRLFQENEWGLRRAVGVWLSEHTPPDASVAMEAIGYQGYYSRRRVIDMGGLVSPAVVGFKASAGSNGVVFRRITTELKPDYIVLRSFEVDENRHFNGGKLFESEADRRLFFAHYHEVRRFTAPHPELDPLITRLTVYERRG